MITTLLLLVTLIIILAIKAGIIKFASHGTAILTVVKGLLLYELFAVALFLILPNSSTVSLFGNIVLPLFLLLAVFVGIGIKFFNIGPIKATLVFVVIALFITPLFSFVSQNFILSQIEVSTQERPIKIPLHYRVTSKIADGTLEQELLSDIRQWLIRQ